jgi:hypothetical protein
MQSLPPSQGGEIWPQERNKEIADPAIRLAWSRAIFYHPTLALSESHNVI